MSSDAECANLIELEVLYVVPDAHSDSTTVQLCHLKMRRLFIRTADYS